MSTGLSPHASPALQVPAPPLDLRRPLRFGFGALAVGLTSFRLSTRTAAARRLTPRERAA